jgi:hypothetical protein
VASRWTVTNGAGRPSRGLSQCSSTCDLRGLGCVGRTGGHLPGRTGRPS